MGRKTPERERELRGNREEGEKEGGREGGRERGGGGGQERGKRGNSTAQEGGGGGGRECENLAGLGNRLVFRRQAAVDGRTNWAGVH